MSLHALARAARHLRDRFQIQANHLRGREYVPSARDQINIETSSLCNLECRFCAYSKKSSPRVSMSNELFADAVEQSVALGMNRIQLTPSTGDVFMDRSLFAKLDHLEQHQGVVDYKFFTNFTIPDADDVRRLVRLGKLRKLNLSLYGHDEASFVAITRSTPKVYRRLIENLETLHGLLGECRPALEIGFRSMRHVPKGPPSELQEMLRRFGESGVRVRTSHVYNNWGGMISAADVEGLDMEIGSAEGTFKRGACALLFIRPLIAASGIVNGCACRDVDMTLRIGDLTREPLRWILSADNPAYVQLIREQQDGQFRPICKSCDFYKSIYRRTSAQRRNRARFESVDEFLSAPRGAQPVGAASVGARASD